jgi:hypothetical protein
MLRGRFEGTNDRPYLDGRLVIPRSNLKADISFLIDTGADTSALMPADARRLGIDYATLTGERVSVGIGGVSRSYTEPVLVAFSDPGKSLYVYQIDIVIPAPSPALFRLPSLLGRDILNRWSMSYNPSRNRLGIRVVSADFNLPVSG